MDIIDMYLFFLLLVLVIFELSFENSKLIIIYNFVLILCDLKFVFEKK